MSDYSRNLACFSFWLKAGDMPAGASYAGCAMQFG
jgi:hypothetical protein